MATRYFKKTLVHTRIFGRDGKPIAFEVFPGMVGVMEVDVEKSPALVEDLQKFIEKKLGGVSELKQEEFETLKKKTERPAPVRAPNKAQSPALLPAADGTVRCPRCRGSGFCPGCGGRKFCATCKGTGRIAARQRSPG